MRAVALLAIHNEERFIGPCLENLFRQGLEVYVIDNGSTDRSTSIASRYFGSGLIAIESFPRRPDRVFPKVAILKRKERLASLLDADWFMHVDADEIRLPPRSGMTLVDFFREAESQGFNAVNFIEYTFVPTLESPDHDHPDFQRTMRWYYPFLPAIPHRLTAWARQPQPVDLVRSGGHLVRFPNLRMLPTSGAMRHYIFLSVPHIIEKYSNRRFDLAEIKRGWHGWRASINPEAINLLSQADLRLYTGDDELDASNPRATHYLDDVLGGWSATTPNKASLRTPIASRLTATTGSARR